MWPTQLYALKLQPSLTLTEGDSLFAEGVAREAQTSDLPSQGQTPVALETTALTDQGLDTTGIEKVAQG